MSDDDTTEGSSSGGELRRQLESFRDLAKSTHSILVEELVSGAPLVRPEELADVPAIELKVKVQELQTQRATEREALVREALKERTGLDGEELDNALASLGKPKEQPAGANPFAGTDKYMGVSGTPPGQMNDLSDIPDPAMRAVMAAKRDAQR